MLTVSVVIPVHTRVEYLREALQSVLNQTRQVNSVYIVSDREDARKEVSDLLFKKVHYISIPKTAGYTQAESLNHGMELSMTDTVLSLDDDDLLCPSYIEHAVGAMLQTEADIVYPDMELFGIDNYTVEATDWTLDNFKKTTVPFGVSLMKKEVWSTIQYNSGLQYLDWDFWWTAFELGFTAYHLKEVGFKYRTHAGQRSRSCDVDAEIRKVKERHANS